MQLVRVSSVVSHAHEADFYFLIFLELLLSNPSHLVMVSRRQDQDKQYQRRVDSSMLSEYLSAERLQDFPPVLSALRISQNYTKCTSCKIPSSQKENPVAVMWK